MVAGVGDRLAQIAERFAGVVQLLAALFLPVFELDVALGLSVVVGVEFVGGVDGDGVLHVAEQLFEVDDLAVRLVVAVEAVGAADGLKEVVVAQLVVEVDDGAGGCVEAGEQLADHDQQFHVGGLVLEAPLGFVFVGLGGLAVGQHVLDVGVVLVTLVALLGFFGDGTRRWG